MFPLVLTPSDVLTPHVLTPSDGFTRLTPGDVVGLISGGVCWMTTPGHTQKNQMQRFNPERASGYPQSRTLLILFDALRPRIE